jgi:dipeptidyl aminopeptidase/acylaminoacyl peptidase
LFYPFQHAFKKYTKQDFSSFRTEALQSFKNKFNDKPTAKAKNQHFIADQEYPAYVNDESLIYMKSTFNKRSMFVMKTGGKEKTIRIRDFSLDNYFAYHNGQVVYAAYVPDPRWGYRTFSDLRLLDVNTGKQKQLTHHTKYFAPDFSADGKQIVTVDVAPSGKNNIHILSAENGQVLQVVPNPEKLFFTYPKFYGTGLLLAAIRHTDGKTGIATIDIKTGHATELIPEGYTPVGFPVVKKDTVYFTATAGTNDRLFALTPANHQLYVLSNDSLRYSIGNYQPAIGDNHLAWISVTAYGYQLHQAAKNTITWAPVTGKPADTLANMGITSLTKGPEANLLASVKDEPLTVSKYNKAYQLFNFHSLIPLFADPNYGISLQGQND